MQRIVLAASAMLALCSAGPARAADVSLIGGILNSCVLAALPGTMAVSVDGTTLTSENVVGGLAATVSVVATGSAPTLSFSAPSLTGPAIGATGEIRYQGAQASQPYTASSSTASSRLIDLFTIHARVTSPTGFDSGTYTVSTTVTCGQS